MSVDKAVRPVADPEGWRVLHAPMTALPMTVLADRTGRKLELKTLDLDGLEELCRGTQARDKNGLPLFKTAAFGDRWSPKGKSLRWDGNVIAITGVEVDYDGEQINPKRARSRLQKAGLESMIYTSPSHTDKKPRWRVVCPTCCPLDPLERHKLVSRLNGVLGGVLNLESWTLSQSFYIGRVRGAPFKLYRTKGKRIDERDDLDRTAKGPPEKAVSEQSGEKCGEPFEIIKDALLTIPNDGERECENERAWWLKILAALSLESDGSPEGLELALEWSDRWPGNDPEKVEAAWNSFGRTAGRMATGHTIIREARKCGWHHPDVLDAFLDLGIEPKDLDQFSLDEHGVINAFEYVHKDELRFNHSKGQWLLFDGHVWRAEETQLAADFARKLSTDMAARDPDKAKPLKRVATWEAIERGARRVRQFSTTADLWNQNKFLLGTPKGTVDLRTGKLKVGDPIDHISKVTATTPILLDRFDAKRDCPLWLGFLRSALQNDDDSIRFIQQWAGYCMTGDTREQKLLFVWGPGGSGKSTTVNTIAKALGDYSIGVATSTLTKQKHDDHKEELARLHGPRMATAIETSRGSTWNDTRINKLTGGDVETARFMRGNSFDFVPLFKLTIVGNHTPNLENADTAAKRRFIIMPFTRKVEDDEKDEDLPAKLEAELSGILSWMVQGCLDWQANGLVLPSVSQAKTEEYFEEQDVFGRWLKECCDLSGAELTDDLYLSWSDFADENGAEYLAKTGGFKDALAERGFEPIKDKLGVRGRGWRGLSLKPTEDYNEIL